MRLFTGISLAPPIVENISALFDQLTPSARINWTPIANLHITSKFIGDWPDSRLADLQAALAAIRQPAPIPIQISGLGFFPNPHRPHSFFAAVHAPAALTDLAASIDHALEPLGCKTEARNYHPHVTLARIKPNQTIQTLREQISAATNTDFGAFETKQFHLYLSQPAARGSDYSILATYDLMREKTESE